MLGVLPALGITEVNHLVSQELRTHKEGISPENVDMAPVCLLGRLQMATWR